jgi:hypothetical protein
MSRPGAEDVAANAAAAAAADDDDDDKEAELGSNGGSTTPSTVSGMALASAGRLGGTAADEAGVAADAAVAGLAALSRAAGRVCRPPSACGEIQRGVTSPFA